MARNSSLRYIMGFFNRFIMTPLFRLGLGAFMGNPFTGYIMVLKTTGRKTHRVRYTPVNYAIMNGKIYCMVGFGRNTDWYRNAQEFPNVELILPGGSVAGIAEEVSDPDESLTVLRQILKNSGFAGIAMGLNPNTLPDNLLQEKLKGFPAVRIRPTGVGNGPSDAGGWLWILELTAIAAVLMWFSAR